ncbi:hypothetical protein MNVI_39160 [Mycobacterium noviomagense]|uniref:Uncharacterized protein n=1 Tax=Mycobacterium noviomagense TaxID=459858 RepID=A0A7I7PIY8_9MYCO|nr:hypothetical protein MNVI_39160 [Mycobacterium noviomagense]
MVLVPVWTRRWDQAALVGLWFTVNPVLFGKPGHERGWSTRAMLGEELWITRRPKDAALAISAATSVAAVTAIAAARRRRLGIAAAATAQMALTLVYWQQMVHYLDPQRLTEG